MDVARNRNLLFAIFTSQHGLAEEDEIVAAMNAWASEKHRPLADLLVERGAMAADARKLMDGLLDLHIARHGSTRPSLAPIEPSSSVAAALASLLRTDDADPQRSLSTANSDAPSGNDASAPPAASASPGELRYRILRPHAKGGLGEVFVAEDLELHRNVALKEIQPRHAKDVRSRGRFLLEAEITGGLEHPGIVPVYGMGAYPDGRPYYAMRFVEGDDLRTAIERFHGNACRSPSDADAPTAVVAAPPLSPASPASPASPRHSTADYSSLEFRQLLRRFIDVCNAVAYAHSRGVLHRDIKPANIMLGKFGETLVVDWGLAKMMGRPSEAGGDGMLQPSSESTRAETQVGTAIGTPAYMSPEQAGGKLDELGPATDVYSLGATLYALLAGREPLEGTLAEILAKGWIGDIAPPRAVHSTIPAALDAVCRKAMALRPADRYGSALELAKEIEAWLADEPVAAYREPFSLRAKRWARQRPRLVAGTLATVLVGLLAAGIGLFVVGGLNARLAAANGELCDKNLLLAAERKAADTARDAAEGRLGEIKKANSLLSGVFRDLRTQGTDKRTEELSIRLGRRLKEAAAKLDADAIRDGETLAELQHSLGFALLELGHFEEAIVLAKATLEYREAKLGPDHLETLASRNIYAGALNAAGKLEQALPLLEANLKASQAELGADHPNTLTYSNNYAYALKDAGKLDRALPLLEATLKAREAKLGPDHNSTLTSRSNYAMALQEAGKLSQALPLFEASLKSSEAKLGADHPDTLRSRNNYAYALDAAGKLDQALPLYKATLQSMEAKLGADHPSTLTSRNNYALALRDAGKLEEALPLLEATLKASEAKLGADHPSTLTGRVNYASTLQAAGKLDRALPLFEAALKGREATLGADHPSTLTCRTKYAIALQAAGKVDQALPLFKSAAAGMAAGHFRHKNAGIILDCIGAYEQAQRWPDAERWRRQWLDHLRKEGQPADIAAELLGLAANLQQQKKPAAAEPLFREALALREKLSVAQPPQALPWQIANVKSLLGGCLSAQKKYADALPLLHAGYDGLAKDAAAIPAEARGQRLAEAAERLAKHYEAASDLAKAKEWQAKAAGHRPKPAPAKP